MVGTRGSAGAGDVSKHAKRQPEGIPDNLADHGALGHRHFRRFERAPDDDRANGPHELPACGVWRERQIEASVPEIERAAAGELHLVGFDHEGSQLADALLELH